MSWMRLVGAVLLARRRRRREAEADRLRDDERDGQHAVSRPRLPPERRAPSPLRPSSARTAEQPAEPRPSANRALDRRHPRTAGRSRPAARGRHPRLRRHHPRIRRHGQAARRRSCPVLVAWEGGREGGREASSASIPDRRCSPPPLHPRLEPADDPGSARRGCRYFSLILTVYGLMSLMRSVLAYWMKMSGNVTRRHSSVNAMMLKPQSYFDSTPSPSASPPPCSPRRIESMKFCHAHHGPPSPRRRRRRPCRRTPARLPRRGAPEQLVQVHREQLEDTCTGGRGEGWAPAAAGPYGSAGALAGGAISCCASAAGGGGLRTTPCANARDRGREGRKAPRRRRRPARRRRRARAPPRALRSACARPTRARARVARVSTAAGSLFMRVERQDAWPGEQAEASATSRVPRISELQDLVPPRAAHVAVLVGSVSSRARAAAAREYYVRRRAARALAIPCNATSTRTFGGHVDRRAPDESCNNPRATRRRCVRASGAGAGSAGFFRARAAALRPRRCDVWVARHELPGTRCRARASASMPPCPPERPRACTPPAGSPGPRELHAFAAPAAGLVLC